MLLCVTRAAGFSYSVSIIIATKIDVVEDVVIGTDNIIYKLQCPLNVGFFILFI